MSFAARCHWCFQPFTKYNYSGFSCWVCPTPKCRHRQERWAVSAKPKDSPERVVWMPLPKQVEALVAVLRKRYRWILFGGARGGGKSAFLRWLGYRLCLQIPNFQAVLLRRTYPELEKSHMRRVGGEVKAFGAQYVPSARPPVVRFHNGSILEFGHCEDQKDVENYLSAEYHLVMPDELGTFEEDMVLRLASSARLYHHRFRPCIVCSTNPGSVWVRDRWITHDVDRSRYPSYNADEYCFIQSLLDDNPYPDPEYEAFLNALDEDTKQAWRYGNWDVFEGQYFKEFRRERHCEVLEIPQDLPRIGGFDWGYSPDPAIMLWAVALPDGHLHIEREQVFRETVAAEVARQICDERTNRNLQLAVVHADPSTKIRGGQSGESIFETLSRGGMPVVGANHERINGWQRLRHWFRLNPKTGKPWLTIDPVGCPGLVRTLPALVHDDTHPEDVADSPHDHWADALRYLVMGRPAPSIITSPVILLPENSVGRMFQEAREALTPVMGGLRVAR